MTPEERADALGDRWALFADAGVKSAVLAALRAAVDEEREACARIAEAAHGAGAHMPHNRVIAAAIRARCDLE